MGEIDTVPQRHDAPDDRRRGVGVYDRPEGNRAKIAAVIAAVIAAMIAAMYLFIRRA